MRNKVVVFMIILAFTLIIPSTYSNSLKQDPAENGWFPFTIPWDDASDNIVNVGKLVLDAPAGKHGFLKVKDSHFYFEDGTRIRFWGTNLVEAANFPKHETADKTAAHMAKFGFNIVRLHLMDYAYAPQGIFDNINNSTTVLSAEQLDRVDYLIYRLKELGIYVDLNLNVGRRFTSNDGVMETKNLAGNFKQVTLFDAKLIELQKRYAYNLLTHYNPYTKTRYNEDPCITLVEITNENSLFPAWTNGYLTQSSGKNNLPDYYAKQLNTKWNQWLKEKYDDTMNLKGAWAGEQQIPDNRKNIIDEAGFKQEIHNETGAKATISLDSAEQYDKRDSIRVDIAQTGGKVYQVQLKHLGVRLVKGMSYTLSFNAKANMNTEIFAGFGLDHSPWKNYGLYSNVSLNSSWKEYKLTFVSNETTGNDTRLSLELGKMPGTLWLNNIKFFKTNIVGLGQDESLEQENIQRIPWNDRYEYSLKRVADETEFYYSLEKKYYTEMLSYLKSTLKIKVPITTTNNYYGQPDLIAQNEGDYIDSHGYWDYMSFPNKYWDCNNFAQSNLSLIRDSSNTNWFLGNFSQSAMKNKPFVISEWNACFPNDYDYEAANLLTAYSLFQDWDGLFVFAYFHETDENYKIDYIKPYHWFNVVHNPGRMAEMASCALAFIRGDIKAAKRQVSLNYSRDDVFNQFRDNSTDLSFNIKGEVPPSAIYSYQVRKSGFDSMYTSSINDVFSKEELSVLSNERIRYSDTGELILNANEAAHEYITYNTPNFQGASGFISGKNIILENVSLKLSTDSSSSLISMDGKKIGNSSQMLLTTVARLQNTDQVKDPLTNGLTNWGHGPVLMEPVKGTIEIKLSKPSPRYSVYALDSQGNRAVGIPVKIKENSIIFEIGTHETPWYEIIETTH